MKKYKLKKPARINLILANPNNVVFTSRKKYYDNVSAINDEYEGILSVVCAVRNKNDTNYCHFSPSPYACCNVGSCTNCFLNANNYLNILKYAKRHNLKVNKL